jgi:hypothetical protein
VEKEAVKVTIPKADEATGMFRMGNPNSFLAGCVQGLAHPGDVLKLPGLLIGEAAGGGGCLCWQLDRPILISSLLTAASQYTLLPNTTDARCNLPEPLRLAVDLGPPRARQAGQFNPLFGWVFSVSHESKSRAKTESEITQSAYTVGTNTPSWQFEALKKLADLPTSSDQRASCGTHSLAPDVKNAAAELIGWLETDDLPVPSIVLCSGGSVLFRWKHKCRTLEVEVLSRESFRFAQMFDDGQQRDGRCLRDLPDTIRTLLQWLLRRDSGTEPGRNPRGSGTSDRESPGPALRVPANTERALTPEQMVEALDVVSRPSTEKNVPLKHRIDYNQAF